MKVYLHFLFSAYFLFKEKGFSNPKFYASVLSTLFITLITLNLFIVSKIIFGMPSIIILAVLPLAIFFERKSDKYFEKHHNKELMTYQYLESKTLQNSLTVLTYFIAAMLSVIATVAIIKYLSAYLIS